MSDLRDRAHVLLNMKQWKECASLCREGMSLALAKDDVHGWYSFSRMLIASLKEDVSDRHSNTEEAIAVCKEVRGRIHREREPEVWALASIELGNLYRNRISGEMVGNLRAGIAHLEEGLTIITREVDIELWAYVKTLIGDCCQRMFGLDDGGGAKEHLRRLDYSIECFEQALDVHEERGDTELYDEVHAALQTAQRRKKALLE